jgi:hypothetical protein
VIIGRSALTATISRPPRSASVRSEMGADAKKLNTTPFSFSSRAARSWIVSFKRQGNGQLAAIGLDAIDRHRRRGRDVGRTNGPGNDEIADCPGVIIDAEIVHPCSGPGA